MTEQAELTEAGIEGLVVGKSHSDVVGTWGGHKAWIVHYVPASESTIPERTEMYLHIGEYYKVGNWPDDYGPSRWEVATKCVKFLDGDLSLAKLVIVAIEHRLRTHGGTIGKMILGFPEFFRQLKDLVSTYRGK